MKYINKFKDYKCWITFKTNVTHEYDLKDYEVIPTVGYVMVEDIKKKEIYAFPSDSIYCIKWTKNGKR